jgi:hypothetical protein
MGNSNDNDDKASDDDTTTKDNSTDKNNTGGEFWKFLKFLMASCLLTAVVFWPYILGILSVLWAPEVVTEVGTVQKIHFVGGFRISTQIDTESRTLLLWNIVDLPRGTPLQMREDFYERRACVANTQRCWRASRM